MGGASQSTFANIVSDRVGLVHLHVINHDRPAAVGDGYAGHRVDGNVAGVGVAEFGQHIVVSNTGLNVTNVLDGRGDGDAHDLIRKTGGVGDADGVLENLVLTGGISRGGKGRHGYRGRT